MLLRRDSRVVTVHGRGWINVAVDCFWLTSWSYGLFLDVCLFFTEPQNWTTLNVCLGFGAADPNQAGASEQTVGPELEQFIAVRSNW